MKEELDHLIERLGYLPSSKIAHLDIHFYSINAFKKKTGMTYGEFVSRNYPLIERETMRIANYKISNPNKEINHYWESGSLKNHYNIMIKRFHKFLMYINSMTTELDDKVSIVIHGRQLILEVIRKDVTHWFSYFDIYESEYKKRILTILNESFEKNITIHHLYRHPNGKRLDTIKHLSDFFTFNYES